MSLSVFEVSRSLLGARVSGPLWSVGEVVGGDHLNVPVTNEEGRCYARLCVFHDGRSRRVDS